MPSQIKYLNVTFRQDTHVPQMGEVYPTDFTTSLPEDIARSVNNYVTINGPGTYEEMVKPGASGETNAIYVLATDSASAIASKVSTLNAEQVNNSPEGRGRHIVMPASGIDTGAMALSTMQSLSGVKGSTIVTFNPGLVTGGGAEIGHLTLQDDSLSRNGIRGNGVMRDLDFNGNRKSWEGDYPSLTVNGYYAPDRSSGKCISHRMDNVAFYNYNGHGCYIGEGNDQMVANRLRAEGNRGFGIVIKSSDVKMHDIGATSMQGSMWIDNCAPEIDTFDLFIPEDAECEATLLITDAQRVQMRSGTVEGRCIIRGRNNGAGNRYENGHIYFDGVVFKHSADLNDTKYYPGGDTPTYVYDSYLKLEDIDGTKLDGCRFGFSESLLAAELPDYLIDITTTTGVEQRKGSVFLNNMSGMLNVVGRVGAARLPRMGCKKHWARDPRLTVFDWGVPGQPQIVPMWRVNAADANMRTHVQCDGVARNKEDYPFGYLCATIDPTGGTAHGTLDDVNTTFTVQELPLLSSAYCWAMRVTP